MAVVADLVSPSRRSLIRTSAIEQELGRAGLSTQVLREKAFEINPLIRRLKEDAVLCYRTQLAALHLTPADRNRWEACLSYELAWEVLR